jgi:hypothetical protein
MALFLNIIVFTSFNAFPFKTSTKIALSEERCGMKTYFKNQHTLRKQPYLFFPSVSVSPEVLCDSGWLLSIGSTVCLYWYALEVVTTLKTNTMMTMMTEIIKTVYIKRPPLLQNYCSMFFSAIGKKLLIRCFFMWLQGNIQI